jgi:hypothetical protein
MEILRKHFPIMPRVLVLGIKIEIDYFEVSLTLEGRSDREVGSPEIAREGVAARHLSRTERFVHFLLPRRRSFG